MIPCKSIVKEVSFEWSHHRISSTHSKVRTTLQVSIIDSETRFLLTQVRPILLLTVTYDAHLDRNVFLHSVIIHRTVPVYFIWLKYISWFMYGFEALIINQWKAYGPIGMQAILLFELAVKVISLS